MCLHALALFVQVTLTVRTVEADLTQTSKEIIIATLFFTIQEPTLATTRQIAMTWGSLAPYYEQTIYIYKIYIYGAKLYIAYQGKQPIYRQLQ